MYRAHPGDTVLTDNVYVENKESGLVLERRPRFKKGESLLGYFRFSTADYFQLAYSESIDAETFNRLSLRGQLHFKCVVKELPAGKYGHLKASKNGCI